MGKTKKQILEEKKLEKEINDFDRDATVKTIEQLSFLLIKEVVDEDKPSFGDMPNYKPVFDEIEMGIIKQKIMSLIKGL